MHSLPCDACTQWAHPCLMRQLSLVMVKMVSIERALRAMSPSFTGKRTQVARGVTADAVSCRNAVHPSQLLLTLHRQHAQGRYCFDALYLTSMAGVNPGLRVRPARPIYSRCRGWNACANNHDSAGTYQTPLPVRRGEMEDLSFGEVAT